MHVPDADIDTERRLLTDGMRGKIMWGMLLMTVWLFIISIMDIRRRAVPVWVLLAGGVLAGLSLICQYGRGEGIPLALMMGLMPGLLLLGVSFATKNAGYGDGIAMLILGMVLKGGKSLAVFGISLFCIAVFSLILLAVRKAGRNTRIPYLPFLTLAWILVLWFQ